MEANALLTVRDLAAVLRISVRSVHRLHRSGELPAAIRIGTALRWRRAEIAEWVRGGCK